MKHALIKNNLVVDVVEETFPVHESLQWAECPDSTKQGHTYFNGTFSVPQDLTSYLDKRRAEYPPIGEQLDTILKEFKKIKDLNLFELTDEMQALVAQHQAIKDKYPKPKSG